MRVETVVKEPLRAHIVGGTGRVLPLPCCDMKGKTTSYRYLILVAATAVGLMGGGRKNQGARAEDAGPDHFGDAHLQRVLRWTDTERQAASDAARKLEADLDAAIRAKAPDLRIPTGDDT